MQKVKGNEERKSLISSENFALTNNKIALRNSQNTSIFGNNKTNSFKKTQSEVREMIKNYTTDANQKNLRAISEALYVQSQQYQRLVNYYASMPDYSYGIVPNKDIDGLDNKKALKEFIKVAEFMNILSVKSNFTKIIKKAMIIDVFFGYVYNDGKAVVIQQIPNELCTITSIEGGVYNYSIDMSKMPTDESIIALYPDEIQKAYRVYKNNRNAKIYEVLAKNSICIKINEGAEVPVPPFAGTFDSIFDINAFKDLRNDKAELDNYKLLVQKLPIRQASVNNNDFALDLNMVDYFNSLLNNIVPTNVGIATTPMDIDVVNFDKDKTAVDNVEKATKDFWDNSGTSQILFSSDNKTSQGINRSIETDEQMIYTILNQIERWINRYLTLNGYTKNFKCVMIETTHFSKNDLIKQYLELAQYGFPVKMFLASLLGIEPISFVGTAQIENEVLNLTEKLVPLQSSFNTSGTDIQSDTSDGGRPTNEDSGKDNSDETERAIDKPSAE